MQAVHLGLDDDLATATATLRDRKAAAVTALHMPIDAPISGAQAGRSGREAFVAARDDALALGLISEVHAAEAAAAERRAHTLRSAEAAVAEGSLADVTARLWVRESLLEHSSPACAGLPD